MPPVLSQPVYQMKMQDYPAGTELSRQEVIDLTAKKARIVMNAGLGSGVNVSPYENDCTQDENASGFFYTPEAYMNMRALAALYRLHGHEVDVTPSAPGEPDGIYATDSDKTFIQLEELPDGRFKVAQTVSLVPTFTNAPRYIEAARKEAELREIARRVVEVLDYPMEFGDTRVFAQGSENHPGPFMLAGIADTSVTLHGLHDDRLEGLDITTDDKFSITHIDEDEVFVVGVDGNMLTLINTDTHEEYERGLSQCSSVRFRHTKKRDKIVDLASEDIKDLILHAATVGRSTLEGQRQFKQKLAGHGIDLEIYTIYTRQPFYHMDTTGFQAGHKHFFTTPHAFLAKSYAQIQELLGAENVIELPLEDIGERFGGNATSFDGEVYISHCISKAAIDIIRQTGYNVNLTDIDYTMKAGGGHRCMTSTQYMMTPHALGVCHNLQTPGVVRKAISDYDTGDVWFGEIAPAAYQAMVCGSDIVDVSALVDGQNIAHLVPEFGAEYLAARERQRQSRRKEYQERFLGNITRPDAAQLTMLMSLICWPDDVQVLRQECLEAHKEHNLDILQSKLEQLRFRLLDPTIKLVLQADREYILLDNKVLLPEVENSQLMLSLMALDLVSVCTSGRYGPKSVSESLQRFSCLAMGSPSNQDYVLSCAQKVIGADFLDKAKLSVAVEDGLVGQVAYASYRSVDPKSLLEHGMLEAQELKWTPELMY